MESFKSFLSRRGLEKPVYGDFLEDWGDYFGDLAEALVDWIDLTHGCAVEIPDSEATASEPQEPRRPGPAEVYLNVNSNTYLVVRNNELIAETRDYEKAIRMAHGEEPLSGGPGAA